MNKLTPNSIKRPLGTKLCFKRVPEVPGLYIAKNAYDGYYEYFKGRPLPQYHVGTIEDNLESCVVCGNPLKDHWRGKPCMKELIIEY